MLDFIYYPVSGILWVWHKVFGAVLGADSGFAWALSVVFLVFTLRLILYKPFVKQVRTTRQMQELQPQIKALQKKYGKDRQKLAVEMQKLQKEHGFNPIMGCLPVLAQAPVFIGLFHVLRSFNRTGTGIGQLGLSPEVNAETPNYFFSVEDVQSFLSARLFGAPISAAITSPESQLRAFEPFGGIPSIGPILAVSIPLMIIASIATHLNSRASVARQSEAAAANPQSAIMNKLALYVFPLGVLVGGPFLPVAILLYWVSNNVWTYAQQHLVFGRIDKEEAAKKEAALERRNENAPKPGARPDALKKKPAPGAKPTRAVAAESTTDTGSDTASSESNPTPGTAATNGATTPRKKKTPPGKVRPKQQKRR
ncbi:MULTISPECIES: membrane protein insertase YidC [unclassified Rhodococcus (in: high G+C Gram-positive bacteria)]|uniref:membrane protein insertase YidC n=1 Tax=unclassified Rhodococcus (in: high G+C Gram-positive bacteria) TaxID=192944 RepID=UPI0004805250|nr:MULTISPECIES: membrane protein insertase YidC [unclassified Rhodococcus (in: high G+C Gram-positive bacteria)]KQU35876.1 preprotein translocase YidC [Rhodococcus sp. Leaf225]KQU48423.1 preprotein translocase YidC [Rhodococcus sp. Leaf258]MBY6677381.1 membrane protein insertase YidC [Rhodococcus sp. BP-332]MBY6680104.1 membrane protein insertase YidC [Rhodococcus sp. BP-316]MBY6687923.1 membrane protein insertase YidC [Rhodococcus sp. BP-288]